jgi:hypothetical protein
MILTYLLAALFIVLAIVFLMGKGDKLIAGYNTASEEEKKKVNITRLRILMAIVSVITHRCNMAGAATMSRWCGKQSTKRFG